MSYSLYRMHWTVEENGISKEMYSFHINSDVVSEFVRRLHQAQNEHRGKIYRSVGAGKEIRTHDGKLNREVHDMYKRDVLGIWKEADKVAN